MHVVRHYDNAVDVNSGPVVVEAMTQDLCSSGVRQDQMTLRAEGQENGLTLHLQMGQVPAVLSLAGLGETIVSRGRLTYMFRLPG